MKKIPHAVLPQDAQDDTIVHRGHCDFPSLFIISTLSLLYAMFSGRSFSDPDAILIDFDFQHVRGTHSNI